MGFYEHYHRVMQEREAYETARLVRDARNIAAASGGPGARRSLLGRLAGGLRLRLRRRPPVVVPAGVAATLAAARLAVPLVTSVLEMTEAVCRLPDGSPGRIAIARRTEADWTALCVPIDRGDASDG